MTQLATSRGHIKPQTPHQGSAKQAPPKTEYTDGAHYFDTTGFFAALPQRRKHVTLRARQALFRQGDPANALYYIEKGRIRLTVMSAEGKQRLIALLGPGNFFGEGCLAGQALQIATAAAIAAAVVTPIDKAVMISLLRKKPRFAEMFSAFLLTRNAQLQDDLIDQLFNSSERRLARVLMLLANFGKKGSNLDAAIPHISQELLAERVGTTRARINVFMNKFRRLGYIDYNGTRTLKVHSSLVNVLIHD